MLRWDSPNESPVTEQETFSSWSIARDGLVTMASDPSFSDLMARLRCGDNEAAKRVFHRFAGQLVGLARRRLHAKIRSKVDPEDILQSVFRSFFRHQAAGEFPYLESWDELWGLLFTMTVRKCRAKWRLYQAERRDCPARNLPDAFPR